MKDNKGITLIALVITIIVLLILAGVSIAMLTGENGLLNRANESKSKTLKAEAIERINMEAQALYTDLITKEQSEVEQDTSIQTRLNTNNNGINYTVKNSGGTYTFTATVPGETITPATVTKTTITLAK